MNTKRVAPLVLTAAALVAAGPAALAADSDAPLEQARPAVHTTQAGAATSARPVQYVSTPWGYTWYGANSYAYAPASYYVAPYYDYYGYAGYDLAPSTYATFYRPTWTTSYYSPSVATYYSRYPAYYAGYWPSGGYGWLPYARPYGSFYRYYGPVYGSGFHLWFGY
jgi:hypothetical protein